MFTTYSCSLTVKPAVEKHLPEEADGAEMQRLLQIEKLKICGPFVDHSCIHFKRLKSLSFGEPRLGKRFFIFAHLKISCVQRE